MSCTYISPKNSDRTTKSILCRSRENAVATEMEEKYSISSDNLDNTFKQKPRLRTLENSLCRIQSHRRGRSSASLPAGPPRYQTLGKIGIKGAREEETRRSTKSFRESCEKSCQPRRFCVDYNATHKRRAWHVVRTWNRANRPTGRGQCDVVVVVYTAA